MFCSSGKQKKNVLNQGFPPYLKVLNFAQNYLIDSLEKLKKIFHDLREKNDSDSDKKQ